MKKAIYLSLILCFSSCKNKESVYEYDEKMPDSFEFYYADFTDSYDSKTNTFKREYLGSTIREVKNVLSDEEKEDIYRFLTKYDFLSLPEKYTDISNIVVLPSYPETLQFSYKDKYLKIEERIFQNGKYKEKEYKNLVKIYYYIRDKVNAKEEINSLPESDLMLL